MKAARTWWNLPGRAGIPRPLTGYAGMIQSYHDHDVLDDPVVM